MPNHHRLNVFFLLASFSILFFFESTAKAQELDVISALQSALQGKDDMRNVLRYLNLAKDELKND